MSQPSSGGNPNPKPPPKFTKPKPRAKKPAGGQVDRRPAPASPGPGPVSLEAPQVAIPQAERSPRTAQLNIRVTDPWREWWTRQLRFIGAETGLKDNQLNALVVQFLADSVDEIRYRALEHVGMVEPPSAGYDDEDTEENPAASDED